MPILHVFHGFNRRLGLTASILLAVLLLSPPAAAPAGVLGDVPRVTMCQEVDALVGPWPVEGYLATSMVADLPQGSLAGAAWSSTGIAGATAPRPTLWRRAALALEGGVMRLQQLAGRGVRYAHQVQSWLTALPTLGGSIPPRPAFEGPPEPVPPDASANQSTLEPAVFQDVLHGGAAAWPTAAPRGVIFDPGDPGGPEADAWIQPGLGPLRWMAEPAPIPTEPRALPIETGAAWSLEAPILGRFADIVLPVELTRRNAAAAWPDISREPTEVILKMVALLFIATVLLIPMACSCATRAMGTYARDGPLPVPGGG